jgi:hypothetical protein
MSTRAGKWSESELARSSRVGRFVLGNGYIVIFSVAVVLAMIVASECPSTVYTFGFLYGWVLWGWWACVAILLWKIGQRVPQLWSLTPGTIALHVFLALALGCAHVRLLQEVGLAHLTPEFPRQMWLHLLSVNRLGMELLIYGFILGIGGFLQFQIRAQREAMRTLDLERQLSTARLRALQMQLEPHFLFNTLNAITTLVELGRQKPAAEMLNHLNLLLKTTLARATPEKISLAQELEFVGNYFAIEQVRFADRLRVHIAVDPVAAEGLVPCFLLQPIVENAIRHGIARCENEGLVELSAELAGGSLKIVVRNSGSVQPAAKQSGHGIGLANTRERLAHFYADNFILLAEPQTTGGFQVIISLPYEKNAEAPEASLPVTRNPSQPAHSRELVLGGR